MRFTTLRADTPDQHRHWTAAMAVAACLTLAGCTSSPATPYLKEGVKLSQAGFVAHPADTTARYAMMNTLPPGELTYRNSAAGPIYLYADPIGCGCVYMGSDIAYRTLVSAAEAEAQQNKQKNYKPDYVLPSMQEMAAETRRDTAEWDWSAWSSSADPGPSQPKHVIGAYW